VLLPQIYTSAANAWAAAGEAERARERLDEAAQTARSSELHFYDAEFPRSRAMLEPDAEARFKGLHAAWETAESQGAVAFLPRIARDLFSVRGAHERDRLAFAVGRIDPQASYPEVTEVRALLRR
jgi:hypothetical protein